MFQQMKRIDTSLRIHRSKWASINRIILDFDGIFTDNSVYVSEDGKESVRCDRRDSLGLKMIKEFYKLANRQLQIFILTKERNPVVSARAAKLNLKVHSGVDDKHKFLLEESSYLVESSARNSKYFCPTSAYLGNDLNDFEAMNICGFRVAPKDAHPHIRALANVKLSSNGGYGCIREFSELLLVKNGYPSCNLKLLL